MIRSILSITGKPGLYKIITNGARTLVVEDLTNGKRFPVHMRDKVVSLGDIAMYTDSGDKPLGEILDKVYEVAGGQPLDVKALASAGELKAKFGEIIPDFDRDRVYDNDVKKLFTWYNLLLASGMTKFTREEEKTEEAE